MILSASRRTDIPAFYGEWFFRRLEAGEVWVRNPMNPRRIARIDLRDAEGVVFWTKNPLPILGELDRLQGLPCYFQFTLTPYGRDWEPGLPHKARELIPAFRALSQRLGPEKVLWRYDPILLDPVWTVERHLEAFSKMAAILEGAATLCTLSFLDVYREIAPALREKAARPPQGEEIFRLAEGFSPIAARHGFTLYTCGEEVDLSPWGILPGKCVDAARLGLAGKKAQGQRKACCCDDSVDIGSYHTCRNGCRYCYACRAGRMHSPADWDPDSPMLLDAPREGDTLYRRKTGRLGPEQLCL